MKIIMVGTGFVGLTHAAVCSEYGHEVYAYDIDQKRIAAYNTGEKSKIEHYVNEPGLAEAIAETKDRYLFFTSEIVDTIEGTDAIFLCLPTPPGANGATGPEALPKLASRPKGRRQSRLPSKVSLPTLS